MPMTQPLRRQNVTEGSVLVLPSYPIVFCLVGLIFLRQSELRTSSPAFDSARVVFAWTPDPIAAWGLVFFGIGLAEMLFGYWGDRHHFKALLVVAAGVCAFWSTLLLWSAASSPLVSFTAGVWVAHSGWCHIASARSLTRDWVVK